MSTDQYMTVQEAADLLGVTRFTISRMIRTGALTQYVSPLDRRHRLVKREEVEALREPVVFEEVSTTGKAAPVAA